MLRSVYGFPAAQGVKAFSDFAGLPRTNPEDAAGAAKALRWMRDGLDFADGLHLAKAEGCEAFISFDQDFAKAANVDLRVPASNHFEKLKGALAGWHSVRVNDQWRLLFRWNGGRGEASEVYLDDHSYR